MNRRTARIFLLPMLAAAVCSCASTSSTPNENNNTGSNNVGGSVINGKVAPDAQGNNRDQPIATDTVTTP